jgi:hypothetical protein
VAYLTVPQQQLINALTSALGQLAAAGVILKEAPPAS